MWDARRRVLKIKSLKHGIIQDKRGNIMRTVFGIDVSKASSEVAILVNGEKIHGYTMLNDAIGFNRLIRTMYYLITHNKLYDYSLTQNR